ncbi:MAG: prepilin-type N-terminal cleavage/methylation domain-containing protein [Candidatus Pacebacteria bacterium]|nr:prepilin-type N-terminal cleavage/methylation domain-containing protein [Candidatus Paceibacterota bacterium]
MKYKRGFTPTPNFLSLHSVLDIFFSKLKYSNKLIFKTFINSATKTQHKIWCRGFTLIELLVVIAIIGILSSVVLASLNTARSKARDTQRTASIKQVQNALEMYYSDNGFYPSSADVIFPGILDTALKPTYISSLPTDPNSTTPYRYYNAAQNPATYYAIRVNYENKPHCYMCAGPSCAANTGWWGINICQ